MLWTKDSRALGSAFSHCLHCLHDNTFCSGHTGNYWTVTFDARCEKRTSTPPSEEECNQTDNMHLRNRALYAVSPSSNPRVSCLADAPPRWQPFRFARRRPARDLGPSHNWERISATKRFHGLHATESFSVLRRTQAYRIYVARHAMPHSAHAQSRRIEVLQHVACREQKANSGKRNPEGAGFAVQGPPEWSPGAGRPVEQDTDGPGAGRLFVEDSRDISHASLLRACGVRTGDKPVSRAEYPGA